VTDIDVLICRTSIAPITATPQQILPMLAGIIVAASLRTILLLALVFLDHVVLVLKSIPNNAVLLG
jgi:hypothetical protein